MRCRDPPTHLGTALRQPRVATDAAHQVELALSVAAEVDGTGRDVNVHQVVDDAALDVVLDPVHQVPAAHIEDLDVGQVSVGRQEGVMALHLVRKSQNGKVQVKTSRILLFTSSVS